MPWSWVVYGTFEIISLFIILERLQRRREFGCAPVLPIEPRPVKSRSPEDCPVCQHPHPKSLWGHTQKPGLAAVNNLEIGLACHLGGTNLAHARRFFDAHPDEALEALISRLA